MKTTIRLLALLFGILLILAFRPISNLDSSKTRAVSGHLEQVEFDSKTKDITLKLEGDDHCYYINRGLERSNLSSILQGSHVQIRYAKHWTPLDPLGKMRHIAELSFENRVVYSELE
ncbi:MAG: hypothetical protein AAF487_07540 [Bacteroidota bacterium]